MYSIQLLVSPREALERCWADTDALFDRVSDWEAHPIDVRHPFCFYYGHLASFGKTKMLPEMQEVRFFESDGNSLSPISVSICFCHDRAQDAQPFRIEKRRLIMTKSLQGQLVANI